MSLGSLHFITRKPTASAWRALTTDVSKALECQGLANVHRLCYTGILFLVIFANAINWTSPAWKICGSDELCAEDTSMITHYVSWDFKDGNPSPPLFVVLGIVSNTVAMVTNAAAATIIVTVNARTILRKEEFIDQLKQLAIAHDTNNSPHNGSLLQAKSLQSSLQPEPEPHKVRRTVSEQQLSLGAASESGTQKAFLGPRQRSWPRSIKTMPQQAERSPRRSELTALELANSFSKMLRSFVVVEDTQKNVLSTYASCILISTVVFFVDYYGVSVSVLCLFNNLQGLLASWHGA